MLQSYVIDASVFIASQKESEVKHRAALKFFKHVSERKSEVYLPMLAVYEVVNNLKRHARLDSRALREIAAAMTEADNVTLIPLDMAMLDKTLRLLDHGVNLKTADLVYVVCAAVTGSTLVTLDKTMAKAAEKIVTVKNL